MQDAIVESVSPGIHCSRCVSGAVVVDLVVVVGVLLSRRPRCVAWVAGADMDNLAVPRGAVLDQGSIPEYHRVGEPRGQLLLRSIRRDGPARRG